MSLAIDVDRVIKVLLPDGWHWANNFQLDSYEYVQYDLDEEEKTVTHTLLGGGQSPPIPSTGFTFLDDQGQRIDGPLTSVLAVITKTGKN